MNEPLSPAAAAVLDAFAADNGGVYLEGDPDRIAAALRAAVDQVVPEEEEPVPNEDSVVEMQVWAWVSQRQRIRAELLAIAAELEAQ